MLGAPETALKERLGHAVVELIATRAGCQATQPYTDYKSIDVLISPIADDLPMKIDAQIKAVTTLVPKGSFLRYRLEKNNYDHLRRTDVLVPRLLLVADLNKDENSWVTCDDNSVTFCNCVYWFDLYGFPAASQNTKVPLDIPMTNRLTALELVALMSRGYANSKAGNGGVS